MNKRSGRVWVNFRELRRRLKFGDVLRHYKVAVDESGTQHQGPCPLPQHTGRRDPRSFSANLERGVFQCFQCGSKGNVLDFAALAEGADPEDGAALRKVAVGLQSRFFPDGTSSRQKGEPGERPELVRAPAAATPSVNAPLDFELKSLDREHECLASLGVEPGTASHFGMGFCSRGLLKGRIAVPLHDGGKLVGYVGLLADGAADGEKGPKYLFPERRERGGIVFEFDRSLLLYNAHRLGKGCDKIIVVQDLEAVWWLHQCGFQHAVALMGPECSATQAELIASSVGPGGQVWIIPNGDADGEELAQSLFSQVATERFVRWVRMDEDRTPADLTAHELRTCLAS